MTHPSDDSAPDAAPAAEAILDLIAHELRTPLQALTLLTDLMLTRVTNSADGPPVEWLTSRLERSRQLVGELERTIEALVSVSRLRDGHLALAPEPLSLLDVVEDVLGRLHARISHAGCIVTVETRGVATGLWDRVQAETIVRNLVSNAVKYGAGRPIEVVVEGSEREVSLAVRDHGPGIPPEQLGRLFRRFERLPGTQHTSGLGLGLWISKNLADALGGTLRAELPEDGGARFVLTLPRARP